MRISVLQQPASCVRVNWGQWGCEGQGNCADRATEVYNNIVPN